jgi:uncharacterized protein YcgI (DUF1989 family)
MKVIEDLIMPVNTGRSFLVKKGQFIRVSAESIVDYVVFNLDNLRERFDQARTRVDQDKIFISTGDKLYSKFNNVMMTIVEDTYKGNHDLQYGMCSKSRYDQTWSMRGTEHWQNYFGVRGVQKREDLPDHGCWENLTDALKDYNIAPEDIPSPFNLFQSMEIIFPKGELKRVIDRDRPEPGKPAHVEFRAEINCLAGVSACPELGKAGKAKPVRVEVIDRG